MWPLGSVCGTLALLFLIPSHWLLWRITGWRAPPNNRVLLPTHFADGYLIPSTHSIIAIGDAWL